MNQFASQSDLSLRNAINAIVEARNNKAQDFAKKRESYENIAKTVDQIVHAIQLLKNPNEEVQELLGQQFLDAIKNVSDTDIAVFRKKYSELDALIKNVYERYRKTEINISVVGMARQGKSTLLQSISGLDNTVIPAFDKTDCTGAVSVIRNVENAATTAKVYFHSANQMIKIINNYIYAICKDAYPLITDFYAIPNIDLERIAIIAGSEEPLKLEQLKSYVNNFQLWAPLIEEYEGKDTFKYITEKEEIIKFVSQHNGKDVNEIEYYYNYLAVKKVEISCSFTYADAGKIVLRDTIGLGDDKMIGLDNAVIDAITDNCDAAVIVKNADATCQLRQDDMNLYRRLKDSCDKRGLDMNKWFFFFINHTKGTPDKKNNFNRADNGDFCNALVNHIRTKQISNAGICMADASDKVEVTNNLVIPMLKTLKENLPLLDKELEQQVDAKIEEVKVEFNKILHACEKANMFLNVTNMGARIATFNGEQIYTDAENQFKQIVYEYRQNLNKPCNEFTRVLEMLSPNNQTTPDILPSINDIVLELQKGGRRGLPGNVYTTFLIKLKNDFTKSFVQMDEFLNVLVIDLQNKVINVLANTMKFDKLLGSDAFDRIHNRLAQEYIDLQKSRGNKDAISLEEARALTADKVNGAWISEARYQLEFLCGFKGEEFKEIYIALEFMAGLSLSVRNFLLHRVRSCIDILDPFKDLYFNPPAFKGNSHEELANAILTVLKGRFLEVQTDANDRVRSLLKEPNIILYSAISEFRDRLLYSCTKLENRNYISLVDTENVWRNTIYGTSSQKVFNKEAYDALNTAQELSAKFTEITILSRNI